MGSRCEFDNDARNIHLTDFDFEGHYIFVDLNRVMSSAGSAEARQAVQQAPASAAHHEQRTLHGATHVVTQAFKRAAADQESSHVLVVSPTIPEAMQRETWELGQFKGKKQLYAKANVHVYLTIDTISKKSVVIKSYRISTMTDFQKVQVAREAWFHPQLDHPCLVHVYAAWLQSGFVVMAVEYCSYGSLYNVLLKRGLFSERDTVVRVVYPLLQAVLYVHSKGFIHRDIKLENILMTPLHAKLADLGLIINQHEEQVNTALGTYTYMAPEIFSMPTKSHPMQFKGGDAVQSYNEKVDTWAIGVLTYELLSGSTPFTGNSVWETVRAIMSGQANPLPVHVSQEAYSFVRDCLMMSSQHRPSIAQLLQHPFVTRFTITPKSLHTDPLAADVAGPSYGQQSFEPGEVEVGDRSLKSANWSDILSMVVPERRDLMLHASERDNLVAPELLPQGAYEKDGFAMPSGSEAAHDMQAPTAEALSDLAKSIDDQCNLGHPQRANQGAQQDLTWGTESNH